MKMTYGQLKGTLLEYLIRQLLQQCGFTSVIPDGHYIFEQSGSGLFFINGKGAAHDADVLMDPPVQLPFSYPSRILFECKAYESIIGLGSIRNALGLRYDINEFEIVTNESIEKRKNNKRDSYAIANRKRFIYQVGVASVEQYSSAAFEFAANNKIPLFSLRWFLPKDICDLFHNITKSYVGAIDEDVREDLYAFLKYKGKRPARAFQDAEYFIQRDNIIGKIVRAFRDFVERTYIALIETGDLIFMYSTSISGVNFLNELRGSHEVKARIYYSQQQPHEWTIRLASNGRQLNFLFVAPNAIMRMWRDYSYDRSVAVDIKQRFFSRIFIFTKFPNGNLPFVVANIDEEWLGEIRR